jgi:hypothetical protein
MRYIFLLTNSYPLILQELSEINSKLDHLVEEVLIIKKAQLGNNTATTVSPKQTFLMQHAAIDEEQCKFFRVFIDLNKLINVTSCKRSELIGLFLFYKLE